jgi:hypothetical protein
MKLNELSPNGWKLDIFRPDQTRPRRPKEDQGDGNIGCLRLCNCTDAGVSGWSKSNSEVAPGTSHGFGFLGSK